MHPSIQSRRVCWICLALAAVTLAVYAPALRCQFLTFDDQGYVTENHHVRAGLTPSSVAWAFRAVTVANWQPLTLLSHMLDCQIYGLRPWGHHLTNVLLHTANVVFLFLLLRRMTGAVWPSACVAALFSLHPTRVESVAWVAERKDVLCGFFFLLTLLAYARYVEETKARSPKRRVFYAWVMVLFVLSLMAKPMAVTLPCILLLLDFWPLQRTGGKPWRSLLLEKLPLLAVSAIGCAVTLWAQQKGQAVASIHALPFPFRMAHALVGCLNYLRVLAFPWHLAVFYPYQLHEPTARLIAAAAVLMAVTGLALAVMAKRPYVLMGWLWFLGMLVPVIGLVQAGGQDWANRFTYLPSIGFFLAVVWGAADLAKRWPVIKMLAPAAIVIFAAATSLELRYWKDTRTLFARAMEITSNNYLAMTLVGSMNADAGDLDGAIPLYREALRCQPDYPEAHLFLGRALERKGQGADAISEYTKAVQLKPQLTEANILLGLLLAREKKFDQAAACYQAALRSDPESASAENDWGRVLQSQGRWQESIAHYQRALQWDPALAEAHNNLGIGYLQTGQVAEGTTELRAALQLNPTNLETEYNLAQALNQGQQWTEAAALLKPLAAEQPGDPKTEYQYGLALEHQGRVREAMSRFAAALLRDPDFPDALNELAWIAATNPRTELRNGHQAVELARRACELTGRLQPAMLLTLAAAYAEAGRFDDATATARQAENLAGRTGEKEVEEKARRLRAVVESRQPFRQ